MMTNIKSNRALSLLLYNFFGHFCSIKGSFQWCHNVIQCIISHELISHSFIKVVSQTGITFDQFACLAACNMLNVDLTRATPDASVDVFRQHVKSICQASDKVIVASYSRKVLGQTGDGHFSPIGGM